ncbi:hypothetical protein PISMIDRAFT_675237 [Pisolithus microcarpus 441]|uniref:Uncharacterized protein n=1 Tax=Pisolithus microcarpus 441 TaxID=765257 RepID=A0A0C9YPH0_9AGAM|nr:hypothetical protein PISMIDRAFT_675237 [Pisolithus microcarpus 441]
MDGYALVLQHISQCYYNVSLDIQACEYSNLTSLKIWWYTGKFEADKKKRGCQY